MDIITIVTALAKAKQYAKKIAHEHEQSARQDAAVLQDKCVALDKGTSQPAQPSNFMVPDINNAKILQTVTMTGSETGWKAGWDLPESLFTITEPGFINMRVTVSGDGSHSLAIAYNPRLEITRQGVTIQYSFSLNHPTNRERNTTHVQVVPGDVVRQFPSRHVMPPNRMMPHNSTHSLVFYPVLVVELTKA